MKIGINATCFNDNPSGAKKRFLNIYYKVFIKLQNVNFVIFEPVDCEISKWFDNLVSKTIRGSWFDGSF